QSTRLPLATEPIPRWDLRQYLEDWMSGNASPAQIIGSFFAFLSQQIANAGIGLGAPVRALYDTIQRLRGGTPFPLRARRVPPGKRTPSLSLNLQPGELVRVKPYEEILATVDAVGNNRGMSFDAEMVPYCGGTYRVLSRVERIIHEKSGTMQHLKNPCIIL